MIEGGLALSCCLFEGWELGVGVLGLGEGKAGLG